MARPRTQRNAPVAPTKSRASAQVRRHTAPTLPEVASYLQDHLGQQLTAALSGVGDPKTVGRWVSGKVKPPFVREVRLRAAYDAATLIIEEIGKDAARAWFLGSSPYLDYTAPAVVLHDARTPAEARHVVPAAISFLEGAY